jgi:hypothetical protein
MDTFQRTFSVSLQVTGGSARGPTPVASGPRHWGQLFRAFDSVDATLAPTVRYTNHRPMKQTDTERTKVRTGEDFIERIPM